MMRFSVGVAANEKKPNGTRSGIMPVLVIVAVRYLNRVSGGIVECTILLISTHALSRVLLALPARYAKLKETITAARVLNASTNAIVFSCALQNSSKASNIYWTFNPGVLSKPLRFVQRTGGVSKEITPFFSSLSTGAAKKDVVPARAASDWQPGADIVHSANENVNACKGPIVVLDLYPDG